MPKLKVQMNVKIQSQNAQALTLKHLGLIWHFGFVI